jgi:hypothetical protein
MITTWEKIRISLLGLGAIFLLIPALYSMYKTSNFILTHSKAQGVVVSYVVPDEIKKIDIFTKAVPEVLFKNKDNTDVVYIPKTSTGFPPKENEKVTIYYDEKDNTKAIINTFGMVWCLPIGAFIIGLICIQRIFSIVKFSKTRKTGKP